MGKRHKFSGPGLGASRKGTSAKNEYSKAMCRVSNENKKKGECLLMDIAGCSCKEMSDISIVCARSLHRSIEIHPAYKLYYKNKWCVEKGR